MAKQETIINIVVPEFVLKALKYSVKASESILKVDKGLY
jgi:hypothetical protein